MKRLINFFMAAIVCCAMLLAGCSGNSSNASNDAAAASSSSSSSSNSSGSNAAAKTVANISVKMLNVGQGDAILVETGAQTILIDTSDLDERSKLMAELEKAKINKIDKLILTHPHADHIGGVEPVLKQYQVGEIYDNGMISTSKLFTGYVKMAKEKNVTRKSLAAGDVLDLGNGVTFKVLFPSKEMVKSANAADKAAANDKSKKGYNHDPNNESIVGMLNYKDFNMLFTGDAEKPVENELLGKSSSELAAQVFKASHHGSKTGSTKNFVNAISPKDVLISCGTDNSYGHPHKEAMKNYEAVKANIYRTDLNGTITLTTDGSKYKIKVENK